MLDVFAPLRVRGNIYVVPVTNEEYWYVSGWKNVSLVFIERRTPAAHYNLRTAIAKAMKKAADEMKETGADWIWATYWDSVRHWLQEDGYSTTI